MLSVDVNLTVFHREVVAFINPNRTLVNGDIVHIQSNRIALFRNPNRTVVVACPTVGGVARIDAVVVADGGVQRDAFHDVGALFQGFDGLVRQRHHTVAVQLRQLLHRNTEFLHQFVGNMLAKLDSIGVLHVVRLFVGLSVEINDVVLDFERLSGQSHAAFHVVFAAVGGSRTDVTELYGVVFQVVTTERIHVLVHIVNLLLIHRREVGIAEILQINLLARVIDQAIILRLVGNFGENRVACGVVEHHDVVQFDLSESLHAAIVPMRPGNIRFRADERQRVLRERHCQRRLRDARAVTDFRHEEIVAREQRFFQRRRGDDVVLEEELVDEIDGDEGEHECIDPRHQEARGTFGVFPPLPADFLRDIGIENEWHDEQSPPRFHPVEKQQVEYQNDDEFGPLNGLVGCLFFFFHCYFFLFRNCSNRF